MAHGYLQFLHPDWEVCSAGTKIASKVNPLAVRVMDEIGIDISAHYPKNVEMYLLQEWDYMITVCGNADETCPAFGSSVRNRLHIGFEDPSEAVGSEEFVINEFRKVRECIIAKISELFPSTFNIV